MRQSLPKVPASAGAHAELRAHRNSSTTILSVNGSLLENSRREAGGGSARVYQGGKWGFASAPGTSGLPDLLDKAKRNAALLGEGQAGLSLSGINGRVEKDLSTRKPKRSQKEKADFVRAVDERIMSRYPHLKGRRVRFYGLDIEKTLATSAGSEAYTFIPRSHMMVQLTMEKDGAPVELMESIGGLGQFEDLFTNPAQLDPLIDKLHEELRKKCEGVHAEAGLHDVILAPDLAGILAHEAVGHTTEADLVLGGSIAGENLGKRVASDLISLVDFAHTAFGEICPVPVFVDDEGTESRDCTLIEKGILKAFMHNRETAARFGHTPLGNARAFEFSDEPLVRMRNTAILPGSSKLADMISAIDKGYLLQSPRNGQADMTGEFMFGVSMGYEIKGGKLGRAIRDVTISGKAFTMLQTVDMVSDDITWLSNGFCGKKQPMTVGMGGPAVKCRISLGGR